MARPPRRPRRGAGTWRDRRSASCSRRCAPTSSTSRCASSPASATPTSSSCSPPTAGRPTRRRSATALPGRDVVLVPRSQDTFFGDVLNDAYEAASGDVLLKVDDDDWYGPHAVVDLLLARRYSGADVVGHAQRVRPPRRARDHHPPQPPDRDLQPLRRRRHDHGRPRRGAQRGRLPARTPLRRRPAPQRHRGGRRPDLPHPRPGLRPPPPRVAASTPGRSRPTPSARRASWTGSGPASTPAASSRSTSGTCHEPARVRPPRPARRTPQRVGRPHASRDRGVDPDADRHGRRPGVQLRTAPCRTCSPAWPRRPTPRTSWRSWSPTTAAPRPSCCPRSCPTTRGSSASRRAGAAPVPARSPGGRARASSSTSSTPTCCCGPTTSRPSCAGCTRSTTPWWPAPSASSTPSGCSAQDPATTRDQVASGEVATLWDWDDRRAAQVGRRDVAAYRRPHPRRPARLPLLRRGDLRTVPRPARRGRRLGHHAAPRRGHGARPPARRGRRTARPRARREVLAPRPLARDGAPRAGQPLQRRLPRQPGPRHEAQAQRARPPLRDAVPRGRALDDLRRPPTR